MGRLGKEVQVAGRLGAPASTSAFAAGPAGADDALRVRERRSDGKLPAHWIVGLLVSS